MLLVSWQSLCAAIKSDNFIVKIRIRNVLLIIVTAGLIVMLLDVWSIGAMIVIEVQLGLGDVLI